MTPLDTFPFDELIEGLDASALFEQYDETLDADLAAEEAANDPTYENLYPAMM